MFEVVKNVYLSTDGLCCYYFMRLWHITSSVYFPRVIYLYLNLNSVVFFLSHSLRQQAMLIYTVCQPGVIREGIFAGLERNLNLQHLNVVLFIVWGMSAYKQTLYWPVTVVGSTKIKRLVVTCHVLASTQLWDLARSSHANKLCRRGMGHSFSRFCTPQKCVALRLRQRCLLFKIKAQSLPAS